jgi:hypothetical protein
MQKIQSIVRFQNYRAAQFIVLTHMQITSFHPFALGTVQHSRYRYDTKTANISVKAVVHGRLGRRRPGSGLTGFCKKPLQLLTFSTFSSRRRLEHSLGKRLRAAASCGSCSAGTSVTTTTTGKIRKRHRQVVSARPLLVEEEPTAAYPQLRSRTTVFCSTFAWVPAFL